MRVLVTTLPTAGHWHPLMPFAEALQRTGHEVAFATTPDGCAAIAGTGLHCFPVGADETAKEVSARRAMLAALGPESPAWAMPNFFAGPLAARRLPDLLAVCDEWRPDVLIREDSEFAGCVAAEARALPHAAVQISAWRPWLLPLVAEPLGRLREDVGLPPDPDLAMLHRHLLVVTAPPGFYADPAAPLPATARSVRHVAFDRSGDEAMPAWAAALPDRPVVYATMGTVFNKVPGVLEAVLAGLREEPVTLVVTTGRDQDPAAFGPQPPNVRVERYVPQSLLFPLCDAVVAHGGTGTVLAALALGLPMVLVPIAADQPDNARRCEQLGVARVVPPDRRTPETFRDAVRAVLGDPGYQRNAGRLREEMARLPGPERAVGWLERLAAGERPRDVAP